MRKCTLYLSALALLGAGAAQASDYKFAPNPSFNAEGGITVTAGAVSLPCNTVLTGTTENGARITSANFSGVSCAVLTPSGLPWPLHASDRHNATLKNVTVSATVLGLCGPGTIKFHLSSSGVITITGANLPGTLPCSVSGTLKTKPRLKIERK